MYINTHTYYSLRYGTIKPKNLLQYAQELGIESFALTDINTTSACMDVLRLAPKYGVRPVMGVDFRNHSKQQFIILAKNNEGFQNINTYLSQFLYNDNEIPFKAKVLPQTFVIYPFSDFQGSSLL
ncbi:MAG: PHP domain-containing protein, partial [Bacteroidota bacterium]